MLAVSSNSLLGMMLTFKIRENHLPGWIHDNYIRRGRRSKLGFELNISCNIVHGYGYTKLKVDNVIRDTVGDTIIRTRPRSH